MTSDDGPMRLGLGFVEPVRAADVLAERLRRLILDRGMSEGAPLFTEQDLIRETGLGRSSVREALRLLEGEGLLVTKAGRHGGTFARLPGPELVSRSVSAFVAGYRIELADLLQVRELVDPACAASAALTARGEEIQAIKELHEKMERANAEEAPAEFLALNLRWHLSIVSATHNQLLIAFMQSLASAIQDATDLSEFRSRRRRSEVLGAHSRILAAIEGGDSAAASRRMARHLSAYTSALSEISPFPEQQPDSSDTE